MEERRGNTSFFIPWFPDSFEVCRRMPDGKQFPVVEFDSISHVIICDDPEENAEQLIRERCDALSADAAGLLYFDRENSVLRPLVYVPGAGTMCWESACGSGTAAIGYWTARQTSKTVELSLKQPGGEFSIRTDKTGPAVLGGRVRILRRNTITVSL